MTEAPPDRSGWVGASQMVLFALYLLVAGDWFSAQEVYWRARFSPTVVPMLTVVFGAGGLAWMVGLWVGQSPRNRVRLNARTQVALSAALRVAGSVTGWLGWSFMFWIFFLAEPIAFATVACFWLALQDGWSSFRLLLNIETYKTK